MINLISHDTLHNLPNKAALLMLKVCVYVYMCIGISSPRSIFGIRSIPKLAVSHSTIMHMV